MTAGCPDGGTCHHACEADDGACFRVLTCEPLSGVFPEDRWPAEVAASERAKVDRSYHYLCCECGGIAPACEFTRLIYDEDDGVTLVAAPPEWGDPIQECPICKHLHQDDDSGAGVFDGTRAQVEAERARYLLDSTWAEWWAEKACGRESAG